MVEPVPLHLGLEAHLARALTLWARDWSLALGGSGATAVEAGLHPLDGDLPFLTEDSFLELERHVEAKVAATLNPGGLALAAHVEHLAEEIAEDVADILSAEGVTPLKRAATRASAAAEGCVAVAIVGRSLVRVTQHLVRLAAGLELFFGLRIVRVAIGMVLHGELAIRRLHFLVGGVSRYAQHFIKIDLGHVCRRTHLLGTLVLLWFNFKLTETRSGAPHLDSEMWECATTS
jgi:hypothetical protein